MKFLKEFDEMIKTVYYLVGIIGVIAIVFTFTIGLAKDVDVLQRDVTVLQADLAELKTEVRAEFEKIDEKADARYEKINETLSIIRSDIAGLKGNSNIKTNASH